MPDCWTLIWIMIGTGLLGGTANYLMVYEFPSDKTSTSGSGRVQWVNFWKAVLVSLCSTIAVPLFLQTILSKILDTTQGKGFPDINYFVFAGFCILASFFSKRFLEDLYAKISKAEQKAENARRKVDQLVEEKKELDDPVIAVTGQKRRQSPETETASDDQQKVIRSITGSGYSYRTVKGITSSTSLSEDQVVQILADLEKMGVAERQKNRQGMDVWRINLS